MEIIFVIIMLSMQLCVICLAPMYAKYKLRKESMSKVDFQRDKDYYRDILKEYSATEISYIDDFKVEEKRDIVSTILNLELKKKIEIIDNQIIKINTSTKGLKDTEKFVFENIKNGKVIFNNINRMLSLIRQESLKDGLVKKNDYINIKSVLFLLISFASMIFLSTIIKNNLIVMIIVFCEFFIVAYYGVYFEEKRESYARTDKGEEVNKKIEGLKQYIKDYSLLHEKDRNDLILWEEYLIYSVIFNLNSTKIVKEMSKLIEIRN